MVECSICGAKNAFNKAEVEGAVINVCRDCIKFGREIRPERRKFFKRRPMEMPEEMNKDLRSDFGKIVKDQRERRKITRPQLALMLKISENMLQRIESDWAPPLIVAEKIGKLLGFNILFKKKEEKPNEEKKEEPKKRFEKNKTPVLTLADIAEIK